MKFVLSASLVGVLACIMSASMAIAAPQQDEETEFNAIVNDLLLPAGKEANDAVALASSDPAKACAMANHAATSMTEAQTRTSALADSMAGKGEDASALDPLKAKIAEAAPQMAKLSQAVCNGTIAQVQTNPQTKDMADHIGGYMKTYTDDVHDATAAQMQGDMPTFCRRTRDGLVPLDSLSAYLVELRKTTAFSPADSVALDSLGDKVAGYKASSQTKLEQCSAYP